MTKAERERFLADVHIGVISVVEEGRGPLTVPIWYGYGLDGEVVVWMEQTSRKARLLREAGRFSLCVQNEQPPYSYVSVEGPITAIETADLERDVRPLARRYYGVDGGDAYVAEVATAVNSGEHIVVRMYPKRWLTVDYSE
jgi:nitroimidazol reductase NimA-like FMN-containing flavoprotein (pyridoxamine 5'-phosphate oxidase superfamily)